MHCVDCHFEQDIHGDGKLYGEPRAAVEIDCIDCHGTRDAQATLVTSGPASRGTEPRRRCRRRSASRASQRGGERVVQRSMVTEGPSGGAAGRRQRHARHPLQRARAPGEDVQRGGAWGDAATEALPRERKHDLLRLPLLLDDELLRLPPLDEGQREEAEPPQRGRRQPQLDELQLPDAARRHLLPGQRRHGHEEPHRAGPLGLRGRWSPRRTRTASGSTRSSRPSRRAASRARPSRPTCPHTVRATETRTLHRLPRLRGERQQRLAGPAAHAGHGPHELHRPLRVRGRGAPRLRGGGR